MAGEWAGERRVAPGARGARDSRAHRLDARARGPEPRAQHTRRRRGGRGAPFMRSSRSARTYCSTSSLLTPARSSLIISTCSTPRCAWQRGKRGSAQEAAAVAATRCDGHEEVGARGGGAREAAAGRAGYGATRAARTDRGEAVVRARRRPACLVCSVQGREAHRVEQTELRLHALLVELVDHLKLILGDDAGRAERWPRHLRAKHVLIAHQLCLQLACSAQRAGADAAA